MAKGSEDKKPCCEATVDAEKKCDHKCCQKAAEKGKICKKCHPDDKKADDKKPADGDKKAEKKAPPKPTEIKLADLKTGSKVVVTAGEDKVASEVTVLPAPVKKKDK